MSKPVTVTLPHELGRDAARERIRTGFDTIGGALGGAVAIQQSWTGDTMEFAAKAMGQAVTGRLIVREADVTIDLVLPGLLAALASRIGAKVKERGTFLLTSK
jgi:hypothetical protein